MSIIILVILALYGIGLSIYFYHWKNEDIVPLIIEVRGEAIQLAKTEMSLLEQVLKELPVRKQNYELHLEGLAQAQRRLEDLISTFTDMVNEEDAILEELQALEITEQMAVAAYKEKE